VPISLFSAGKQKANVRRICTLGGILLSELHPRSGGIWRWVLGACLFAHDAGVGALAKRDGAWAVLRLRELKSQC